jgi:hypothetical protein
VVRIAISILTIKPELTLKHISDWDIVMDGGRERYTDSHLETHKLTQKDISEWDIVMSVSIFTSKKTTYLTKRTFQIGL